jgi:hypothetical protein
MPGPEDETAAAEGRGRGELRASNADREQVIEVLKAAFVQGRLAKDEFDLRVGRRSRPGPTRSWPQSPPASPPSRLQQSRPRPSRASRQFCGPAR